MTENPSRRLFFAVELDDPTRLALAELVSRLEKAANFCAARPAWIPPGNHHVTLFFLGEIALPKAERLVAECSQFEFSIPPFALDVRTLGFFPEGGGLPPKVLWLGVHKAPGALILAREACAQLLRKHGLPVPDQDFTPHVTLARFKSTRGIRPFRDLLEPYKFSKLGKSATTHISLVESHTGGGQARYETVARIPLRGEPN